MNLLLVWKSNNETDIHNFIIPYAYNAKTQGWFDDVTVLIWGASQEYVRDHTDVQDKIKKLIQQDISVYACKMCADNIKASNALKQIGVLVEYTGEFLSKHLQDNNTKVITL